MKQITQIKEVMIVLSIMTFVPLCGMKKELKKIMAQRVKDQKREFVPRHETLIYPENAHIVVDEALLKREYRVIRFYNCFIVPIGMDATLIHKELVPERFIEFKM